MYDILYNLFNRIKNTIFCTKIHFNRQLDEVDYFEILFRYTYFWERQIFRFLDIFLSSLFETMELGKKHLDHAIFVKFQTK